MDDLICREMPTTILWLLSGVGVAIDRFVVTLGFTALLFYGFFGFARQFSRPADHRESPIVLVGILLAAVLFVSQFCG